MVDLAKHIEILLLEHDCVIVPKLGGFIANHEPARYGDGKDGLFLPPYRNICFNKELKANDGLLVQSYMTAYDASYPDAYKQMEMDIDDVVDELAITGSYTLNGIGTMCMSVNGNITLEPISSGLLSPALFGLYSVEMKSAEEVKKERELMKSVQSTNVMPIQSEHLQGDKPLDKEQAGKQDEASISDNKDNVTIHISRKWLDLAVASAAAIILFFFFYYPSTRTDNTEDTCVAGIPFSKDTDNAKANKTAPTATSTKSSKASRTNKAPEDKLSEASAAVNASAKKSEMSATNSGNSPKQENKASTDIVTGRFVIVLASYVTKSNAEAFIQSLSGQGYDKAQYTKKGKVSRITYAGFDSYDKANAELGKLRNENPAFRDAWVLDTNK